MKAPGYVTLYRYHAKNKRHEPYHALVLSSREVEGNEHPVLTVAHFDHLNTAAHHALNGVNWADTIDRTFDVPHRDDGEGQPFYYEDTVGDLQDALDQYVKFCFLNDELIAKLKADLAEQTSLASKLTVAVAELTQDLANTTEGRDKALQAIADANAAKPQVIADQQTTRIPHETKHYADGSSATGPGPLPDQSPEGAPVVAQGPAQS